jgi:hypothetical protein
MSLTPTTTFSTVLFEQPYAVTSAKKFYPVSVESITLTDTTAADYTKTVGSVAAGEFRPYSIVKVAVTSGHEHAAVLTLDAANRQVGDIVEVVFTPSQVISSNSITIKDQAATPNTVDTITSTSDTDKSKATRKYQLNSDSTWTQLGNVRSATGTLVGNSLTLSTGSTVTKFLVGTKTWDPASITAPNTDSTTVTVTGAAVGDYVVATLSTLSTAAQLTAYVSGTDTVTAVVGAYAGTVNLASGTLNVIVIKAS